MAGCSIYGSEKLAEFGWEGLRNSELIRKAQLKADFDVKNYRRHRNQSVIRLYFKMAFNLVLFTKNYTTTHNFELHFLVVKKRVEILK